jgi:acyl carrier protein
MTRASFRNALEDILEVPNGSLKESDTRDSIPAWSSLADVKIMTMIDSEMGLEPDAELIQAESIGELLDILEQRRAFAG